MFPSLETKLKRFEELESQLQDPAVLADTQRLLAVQREYGGLAKVARVVREYHQRQADIEAARMMLEEETDPSAREYAQQELDELVEKQKALETELEDIATAGDSITRGGLIMEIRAGTGGDEAALFAGDLLRMYLRYAERRGWAAQVLDENRTELGGYKDVQVAIKSKAVEDPAEGVWANLKYEGGVHRVQRVPVTESQGRIHTSAAGVLVFPEVDDPGEIEIDQNDLRIDVFRSSGPGGQSVNTTDSAVRITHEPTGIVVSMQNEKSQLQNREAAMRVLRARLLAAQQEAAAAEAADLRRSQVRTVDRSERIRTYNFPENRIADHRTGYKAYNLDHVLDGDLEPVVRSAIEADEAARLAEAGEA
jgi:peptide chain release factor 1